MRIGILALQGDFAAHGDSLRRLGVTAFEVRQPSTLPELDGLVLPGGESTTMLKLMEGTPWEDAIRAYADRGGAVLGTCAGLILLARQVRNPAQRSLGILDVDVDRNAYGRQVDSFETEMAWSVDDGGMRGVFIRAPRITRVGQGVEILARHRGDPVLVRQDRVLAAAFHPELTTDVRVHELFLELARGAEFRESARAPA